MSVRAVNHRRRLEASQRRGAALLQLSETAVWGHSRPRLSGRAKPDPFSTCAVNPRSPTLPICNAAAVVNERECHAIFTRPVAQNKLYPRTALVLLTTLNLLNYVDRSVLFAVQPLVQTEFRLSNAQVGYLTSAFLLFYMIAAPFVGPLADRFSRKRIIAGKTIS